MIETRSFLTVETESDFSLANLPLGMFSLPGQKPRIGTRIGDNVIDLTALAEAGYLNEMGLAPTIWQSGQLNDLAAIPKTKRALLRTLVTHYFTEAHPNSLGGQPILSHVLVSADQVRMHLPGVVGDYSDFYSSIDHARHVGALFRDKSQPLLPNYVHLPVAYHGRSSSLIVSEVPVHRPWGQINPQNRPTFEPTQALDFELEVGCFMGQGNPWGQPISIQKAREHILGLVLVNDWSARDIQQWEYLPLGPFLAKSFATSLSPWVVTLEALDPFFIKPRPQNPPPLPYLNDPKDFTLDIQLEVLIKTSQMTAPEKICQTHFSQLYWTLSQQIAHHTSGGCNLRPMDLLASGTISGPNKGSMGSLLELTENGKQPLLLSSGETRTYLQDGDEIIMRAFCQNQGQRIGFGELKTQILPPLC